MKGKDKYLLDTSALFAFTDNEEGASAVQKILEDAKNKKLTVYISAMSIMELFYVTRRQIGEDAALQMVLLARSLPVTELPLADDLVKRVSDYLAHPAADGDADQRLWPGKWYRRAGEILHADLAAARKAWLKDASNPRERKEW